MIFLQSIIAAEKAEWQYNSVQFVQADPKGQANSLMKQKEVESEDKLHWENVQTKLPQRA